MRIIRILLNKILIVFINIKTPNINFLLIVYYQETITYQFLLKII
jgi:hypothetical protein